MNCFPRPNIVISRCIEFDHCRYDGSMITSDFVAALKPHAHFIPVCAEMEIGLGVPRSSIRIVSVKGELRLIQPATGLDVTDRMVSFSRSFLCSLSGIDGFILKFRSPSCGMKDIKVYSSQDGPSTATKAAGFFGGAVVKSFPDLAIEDEGRLRNNNLREHFLTRIFTLAAYREVEREVNMAKLIRFHSTNKLLLAAHSQKEAKVLGNIVANREGKDISKLLGEYHEHLAMALMRPPRYTSKANVLMHSLGYFSHELSSAEKAFFLQSIEKYKQKKLPFSAPLSILQSWIARFDEEYLKEQTFFEPFPENLIELCRDTQCEWAGADLFEGRKAGRAD